VLYPGLLLSFFLAIWLFVREMFNNLVRFFLIPDILAIVSQQLFQMIEEISRSPESRDIFELQYHTNCSINYSFNGNPERPDAESKV
jgi:hypothetical protein